MPKYTVTITHSFEFDTDQYYDVDDGIANFNPDELDSITDYLYENVTINIFDETDSFGNINVKRVRD